MTLPSAIDLEALQKLEEPENYFEGREPQARQPPRNILLFERHLREDLRPSTQDNYQHHRHVLLHSYKGSGTLMVGNSRFRLDEGHTCLILPFQVHFFPKVHAEAFSWLFVTFEGAETSLEDLSQRSIAPGQHGSYLLARLLALWSARRAGLAPCLELLLQELKHRAAAQRPVRRTEAHHPAGIAPQVNHWLYSDRERAWRIPELAEKIGFSPGYLRARFRKETGLSLGSYLQQVRLNRAASLLVNSGMRVSEIAFACGYETIYAFSRAFKRSLGASPTAYRERHRATL